MKTINFLSYLKNLGITLWVENSKLRYQAPKGAMTPEIKQEIGTRKPEILAFLKTATITSGSVQSVITPAKRDEDLPLSFAQQRLWFVQQLSPDSQSYNMLEALELKGTLNIVALEQSLSELIRRHEVLRTTFPTVDGKPIQRISPEFTLSLPIHNLQELSKDEQAIQIRQMAKSLASQPFDLAAGPLVKFTLLQLNSQEHVLLLKMHHIIYDGWSLSIFFSELSELYAAFTQGLPSPLPELPIQYADFAVWQRGWLTGEVLDRQLNYWQKQLADVPKVLELPTDKPRPPLQTFQGEAECFQLGRNLTQSLKQLSQHSEATLFMTLLAAFFVLMFRYTGQSDIVIGSPIANRNNKSVEQLMGFFANTIALRGDLRDNPSFADFHRQVRQTTLSAYAHQDLPFEMLVEKLQLDRDLSRNPLVQVMFSLQNTPNSEGSLSGLNIQSLPLPIDIKARFDLEVNFWETDRGLEGVWFYNTDLFNSSTINRIAQHFQTLLKAIVANPQQRISELPLLSPAERQQLLVEWNSNQVDYPSDKCIHQLFEEQVERNPDAVAIVFEDQELTYQELNSRANQLAHYLQYAGIKLEDKIGVFIERSPFMAIAILAILKAGGAYVPLDTAYPSARLALMIEDVQCPILITQDHLANRLPVNNNQLLINIDSQWESIAQYSLENLTSENLASENLATKVTRNNLAYIIYTSGSTGTPKGTEVLHRNVIGFMFGVDYVHLDPEQIWLQHSSISWDALTLEFWTPLLSGARCVLYPSDTTTPEELGKIIKAQNINILWLTSALFNLIIDTMSGSLLNVKQLIIGGEALSVDHVRRALTLLPDTQIINGYGPSECTVFTCCYPIPKQLDKNLASIPIGKPIGDRKVYLLDSNLQPVPIGVSGEIYVGGDSVARGYVNQLTLTREKFIPNHFVPGDTLYKTGDLARHLPDGNIEYLGRIDNQVKIRGFRIELGEVETALSQHKDIQVCYAIARVDTPGEKRLVAYVVPQKDITVTTSELRQFLGSKLPGYMIPSAFVILESLPLTANGKVDRRALKAPDNNSDSDRFIEARNQLELKLVQIWSKVLKVNKIGVQDNFFDLGGHSLLASYLMTQIQQQFDKDIPLTALFQNPTIEEFATILHKDSNESNSSCLVAIQPNGSNLPFFCVPGAGGRPFYFYNLGRYLGDEQPFYSFENDMYQDYGSITRIEDIANIYIQAMQAVQPEGPYFLGGHSYGGNVAFEMAQQLHKQGHSVGLLAIIDSSAPTYKDKQMLMDYIDWDHARWLAEVSKGIEVYLDKNVDISYETLQYLSIEEQLEYVLNYFKMANMLPPNAGTTQLTNIVQAYKTSCLCLVDYVPKQMYPGKITVLRANEDMPEDPNNELASEVSKDFSLGWSEFSTEPVDINFVLGNHITIMAEPHVQVLAEQLNVCIQKHR